MSDFALRQRTQKTIVCAECQTSFQRVAVGSARVIHCRQCARKRDAVKRDAARQLSSAIRRGLVEPWFGKQCVDCGKPAQCHEHRDYTRPLAVEPTCNSCNRRRPPAKWKAA